LVHLYDYLSAYIPSIHRYGCGARVKGYLQPQRST
jgi:hypothetical protein